jgi:putative Mg2+ transporter-C (MgtC) family protein
MSEVWQALRDELTISPGDLSLLVRHGVRLLLATACGGVLGLEREWAGKIAGLRTHMLTAAGVALFVLVAGMADSAALSRVVQGVATGIGFLGAGVILKRAEDRRIFGVTSAAGVWMTAAVGVAAAAGRPGLALTGTLLALLILTVLGWLERCVEKPKNDRDSSGSTHPGDGH